MPAAPGLKLWGDRNKQPLPTFETKRLSGSRDRPRQKE